MADANGYAAATVSLGQTVIAYTYFLPRLSEVRRAQPDDELMRGDVRLGQIAAAALSGGIGITLSYMTQSPLPVYVAAFIAIIIAVVYQYAMSGERGSNA